MKENGNTYYYIMDRLGNVRYVVDSSGSAPTFTPYITPPQPPTKIKTYPPYQYVKNNPINKTDPEGEHVYVIFGARGPTGTWIVDLTAKYFKPGCCSVFGYMWPEGRKVIRDMRKLCDKEAAVIGHSFGGWTALQVGHEVHDIEEIKVTKIILLDAVINPREAGLRRAPSGIKTHNYYTTRRTWRRFLKVGELPGAEINQQWDDPDHDGHWEHCHIPCWFLKIDMSKCERQ